MAGRMSMPMIASGRFGIARFNSNPSGYGMGSIVTACGAVKEGVASDAVCAVPISIGVDSAKPKIKSIAMDATELIMRRCKGTRTTATDRLAD